MSLRAMVVGLLASALSVAIVGWVCGFFPAQNGFDRGSEAAINGWEQMKTNGITTVAHPVRSDVQHPPAPRDARRAVQREVNFHHAYRIPTEMVGPAGVVTPDNLRPDVLQNNFVGQADRARR
jgi:hypothetical protein